MAAYEFASMVESCKKPQLIDKNFNYCGMLNCFQDNNLISIYGQPSNIC